MRESTSNGPVRSIWSMPSNSSAPIAMCRSVGIMVASFFPLDKHTLSRQALAYMPSTPRSSPTHPRLVELLAFPSVQLLDVAGPLQVFATCNDRHGVDGVPPYDARVIARDTSSVTSSSGLALTVQPLPTAGSKVDTLIVAGGGGIALAAQDRGLMDWLVAHAGRARRVASVCTGGVPARRAGLLDGRRAATHWSNGAELAARYPKVHVESDPIFVRDGSVWTSAGVTAGIDLALALVEEDLGRDVALDVARYLVVFLKRPAVRRNTARRWRCRRRRSGSARCTPGSRLTSPRTCR